MQLDNVVFTPHLGSATGPTRQAMIRAGAGKLICWNDGGGIALAGKV